MLCVSSAQANLKLRKNILDRFTFFKGWLKLFNIIFKDSHTMWFQPGHYLMYFGQL